jgi:cold shock CspA family protein
MNTAANSNASQLRRGVVGRYVAAKGYGFVIDEAESFQAFVHWTSVVNPDSGKVADKHIHWPKRERAGFHLLDGQCVTYELVQTERGPRALNVRATIHAQREAG